MTFPKNISDEIGCETENLGLSQTRLGRLPLYGKLVERVLVCDWRLTPGC